MRHHVDNKSVKCMPSSKTLLQNSLDEKSKDANKLLMLNA